MFVKIYTIYYNNNINCLRTQAINVYNKERSDTMANTTAVYARIDTKLKDNAESILS